ncbi:hypothetical protein BC829DRAFT_410660 [Chytridium lagenaria]|nr:hypothetical protein BC829DRAFT_410660 [Chytridium lagenaria]
MRTSTDKEPSVSPSSQVEGWSIRNGMIVTMSILTLFSLTLIPYNTEERIQYVIKTPVPIYGLSTSLCIASLALLVRKDFAIIFDLWLMLPNYLLFAFRALGGLAIVYGFNQSKA